MEHEAAEPAPALGATRRVGDEGDYASGAGELLDRIGLIEAQPLAQRAQGFEQLHDELVAELQRSDHEKA